MKLQWKPLVATLAMAYFGFVVFIGWAMRQSPERFGHVMASMPGFVYPVVPFETMWTHARAGTLNPGDVAPDFSLQKLDKTDTLRLSSLASKQPVALIFGSYT